MKSFIQFIITCISAIFIVGCNGNCTINETPQLQSITITVNNSSIPLGYKTNIKAVGAYSDNINRDITSAVKWASESISIANFVSGQDTTMLSAESLGSTNITASLNGITSNSLPISVTDATLESIVINTPSNNMPKGFTTQFTADGIFSDDTHFDITNQVAWVSESSEVLSINQAASQAGLATGLSEGTSTISATLLGTNTITSNTINVTVTSAVLTLLQISPNPITLAAGQSKPLTVTGVYSDGSSRDDLADEITWASTNNNIISVQDNIATGKAPGTAEITASIGNISATVDGTTTLAVLTSVSLKTVANESNIAKGTIATFIATGTYSDGSTGEILNSLGAWSSSNPNTFNISNGVATAMESTGSSEISVTYNGVSSGKFTLTATPANLISFTISTESTILYPKFKAQIIATGTFTDGAQDLTPEATWISSDPNIINIDKGLITANESGTATITATYPGGFESSITITVLPAFLESIHIEFVGPFESTLYYGMNTTRVKATGYYNNNESIDLTTRAIWTPQSRSLFAVYTKGEYGYAIGTFTQIFDPAGDKSFPTGLTAVFNGVTSNNLMAQLKLGSPVKLSSNNIILSKNPITVGDSGTWSVVFTPSGETNPITIPPGYLSYWFQMTSSQVDILQGQSQYTAKSVGNGQIDFAYSTTPTYTTDLRQKLTKDLTIN